jgi:probable rRNA maturation factor
MASTDTLTVTKKTKGTLPRVPFVRIKNAILGKEYDLSISFVGPTISRTLNRTYREKDYPTNVLSFPLSENSGELVLCETVMKKEYRSFSMSYTRFVTYLLIHGMLHLKGYDHGSTMEHEEEKFLKKFSL